MNAIRFLIVCLLAAGCAAHDIEPYRFEARITTQSHDGVLADHWVTVTTSVRPQSGDDIVTKNGDCLTVKGSAPYVLECNVKFYAVKSMNCINCGK